MIIYWYEHKNTGKNWYKIRRNKCKIQNGNKSKLWPSFAATLTTIKCQHEARQRAIWRHKKSQIEICWHKKRQLSNWILHCFKEVFKYFAISCKFFKLIDSTCLIKKRMCLIQPLCNQHTVSRLVNEIFVHRWNFAQFYHWLAEAASLWDFLRQK